ncbi:MAG: SusD/RagB family nutrient-binding outer membrane lipoprotein [Bacteroidota bacterium]
MKRYNLLLLGTLLMVSTAFMTSCTKDFGDTNINPNQPTDVPVNLLLPSAQASLAYTLHGDIARYNAVFTQNVTGADRQFAAYNLYIFNEEDFSNAWNNMYAGNMADLNRIIDKAIFEETQSSGASTYNAYRGIARIMMAYSLSTVSDMYGDVPYTQAFQGNSNTKPTFDSQEDIYTQILPGLLSQGIADLSNTGSDLLTPGTDDLVYGGDLAKWAQLANGLSARLAIHLSKFNNGTDAAQAALAAINAGALSGGSDDAEFMFGTAYQSPWFQYIDQRADISYSTLDYYYGIGCFHTDYLQSSNDPRFEKMIDVNGDYYAPGFPSAFYMSDDAKVPFFTFHEQKFIEAEANLILGNDAAAETALNEAVDASMEKLGVDASLAASYKSANVVWGGTYQDKLNLIMTQKYVSNYLQPESYNDWRRTGLPDLQPNAGAATGIPRRYIYPTSERQNNPNCPQNSSLFSPRLWWDQ